MRKGEISGLHWKDIDFKNNKVYIRKSLCRVSNDDVNSATKYKLILLEPKTDKSKRCLPLKDEVMKELLKHKERQTKEKLNFCDIYVDNDIVFANQDGSYIEPRALLRIFHNLLSEAGIEHYRFHDMRHAFASILFNENVNPKVIQELLEHNTISTTLDIYSHVIEETKIKSIDKLMEKINL